MSFSRELRGGGTVPSPVERKVSSTTQNNSNRKAILAAIGLVLIVTELYSHMPFSKFGTSPIELLVTTLFSVDFWSSFAPLASLSLKLSPMSTVLKFRKQQDVGGLPLLPYSAMYALTFVLAVYGFLIGDLRIMLTHGTGHIISSFYCFSYLQNCSPTANHLPGSPKLHKLVCGSILSATCLAVWLQGKNAAKFAGMSSVLFSSVMYIGPLTVLRSAIKKRSAKDIPLPFAINSFLNSFAWSIYGFYKMNDWMIYTPCLIGFISSTAQILINILYREEEK
uniref:Sugar transporter SWEET n=1 Tax=Eucampia antarctica TaxID=49252 RepID=A0A7S2WAD4_9STRA|mmetsp:Transcript_24518/g.23571  ORF Transcript_24518/g.23571 Transcript_24518/m.23571 type:complete len:280 (+) Transcript_24518:2-841(+)